VMISLLKGRIVSSWLFLRVNVQELTSSLFTSFPYLLKRSVCMMNINFVTGALSGHVSPNDRYGSDMEEKGLWSSSPNCRMAATLWTDDDIQSPNHSHSDFPLLPSIRLTNEDFFKFMIGFGVVQDTKICEPF
jgi:hypothetical protein